MPGSNERHPEDLPLAELRRFTACRLVQRVDVGHAILRMKARKDMSRRTLWIYVEWDPGASGAKKSLLLQNARAVLQRWVWDGWGVSFEDYGRAR